MALSMDVRVANNQDFHAVLVLDRTFFSKIPGAVDGEHIVRVWIEQESVLLALIDNHPVGYAIVFRQKNDDLNKPMFFLYKIGVLPAVRRRGIGKSLLAHVIDSLAKVHPEGFSLDLTVDPDNVNAVRLYASIGFKERWPLRKDFYGPGKNRRVMTFASSGRKM